VVLMCGRNPACWLRKCLLQVSYVIAAFKMRKLAPPFEAALERRHWAAKLQPPGWWCREIAVSPVNEFCLNAQI